jgi:acetyl esterase/lipase
VKKVIDLYGYVARLHLCFIIIYKNKELTVEGNSVSKVEIHCDDIEWLYAPDEEYYAYKDCKRYLQLIIPYRREWKAEEKFPLLIFIPGSAWKKQEMYNDLPKLSRLAERGIVLAALQYRESDIAPFPAQIYDVHHAVDYLIENSQKLHIDTDRIYIAGNSSGGHIALMSAFTKAHGLHIEECRHPYEIKGLIAESAPSDLMLCQSETLPPWMKKRPTAELLGVEDVRMYPDLARKASCFAYITKDVKLPPLLLLHGDQDPVVTVEQSRRFYNALNENEKSVRYYELLGSSHCGADFWADRIIDIVVDFVHSV